MEWKLSEPSHGSPLVLSSLLLRQLHVLVQGDVFLSLDLSRRKPWGSATANLWLPCSTGEDKKNHCCSKPRQCGPWMLRQHSLARADSYIEPENSRKSVKENRLQGLQGFHWPISPFLWTVWWDMRRNVARPARLSHREVLHQDWFKTSASQWGVPINFFFKNKSRLGWVSFHFNCEVTY